MGAGLGGGSSDAASVLLALNRLWKLDWPRARLAALARTLGADVAVLHRRRARDRRAASASELTPVTLPTRWLALMQPAAHVRTADIFARRN